ncbi:MAG: geranylgeranyl diphosphate synthase type II [Candidatus Omnitrophota bacterium]|jgi:geranylgeranyl diphosphate synthase type II
MTKSTEEMDAWLKARKAVVDLALQQELPTEDTPPILLHQAMRYSTFAGGKRIRPILALAAAEALGVCDGPAMLPALALEVFHTYTLIHDDLPCMDDDDLRRGQPTAHIKFGEANAILAGDALLTLSLEWMARAQVPPPWSATQFVLELAQAGGAAGVIAGQVADLAAEAVAPDAAELDYIHRHKTAALIRCSLRVGAIAGGANEAQLAAFSLYGEHLGLAFQIVDDILDETASTEALGKPQGSDRVQGKTTYATLHGIDAARTYARELHDAARKALDECGLDTDILKDLATFVIERGY